ncbi:hypothetical protein GCM10007036_32060 [Alsobacter metallidurans]|uniref:Acyltransferase 3 domain-containing protein n=1 Tax=Alsobacter metallidurans TaxID=340221 RepID=A0A917IA40_9HYPH|nr:acyltransferase [Alsobacter metallidurans]GGH25141.1 hypothetical protein GCM10007036_32060 [Alsobacter metallidurans]
MSTLPKHMPALDGLRGVAILMVILHHAAEGRYGALAIYERSGSLPMLQLPEWLSAIAENGMHGVQLFFVVSAFTLTCRMSQNGGSLAHYALRRLARIGPGYWIALLGYGALAGFGPTLRAPDGLSPMDLLIGALFGSVWQGGAALAVVPGGWSISCEVAFYVALPVILVVLDGRLLRALLLCAVATLLALQLQLRGEAAGTWTFEAFVNPLAQAPVFVFGVAAALAARRFGWRPPPGLALALVAMLALLPAAHNVVFAMIAAAATALAARRPPALLASRPLRAVGEVSYSMYLVHFALALPCLEIAERVAPRSDWTTLAVSFPLLVMASFAVALVTHRWIEKPFIIWAGRFGSAPAPYAASGFAAPPPSTVPEVGRA